MTLQADRAPDAAVLAEPVPAEAPATLLVGPLLRYVDATSATVWVETSAPATVTVTAGSATASAPTWGVHGHHYAVVVLEGLAPASTTAYRLDLDGAVAWPPPAGGELAAALAGLPPSTIRTLRRDGKLRLSFGSCRRTAGFDAKGLKAFGADALVQTALQMAQAAADLAEATHGRATTGSGAGSGAVEGPARADGANPTDGPATWPWPDALLFAGDQVYADEPSEPLVERLEAVNRGGPRDGVAGQVGTFEQYTWLYHEAWTVPEVRWLLSTVPTAMLLDDHDLRDDWNTSAAWREEASAQPWWRDRVVGAFGSYAVYQHLGNLSPVELAAHPLYTALLAAPDDRARSAVLDEHAWRADTEPASARWSFTRDFGDADHGVRLLAVDSRCSRDLRPHHRRILDDTEWAWVREAATTPPPGGRIDHLLLASPLPVLLMHGFHDVEGWDERLGRPREGRLGRWRSRVAETVRQAVDLEHWPAFRTSFDALVELLGDVARSPSAPASVLMMGGDVHCSYTAQAQLHGVDHPRTAIHQLVMSPFRNPLHGALRLANGLVERGPLRALCRGMARLTGLPLPAVSWTIDHGPWFENGIMTVVVDGREAQLEVDHYMVRRGRVLRRTTSVPLTAPPA
ncbi:MAG: Phosphodiesterase/alkaline phosphatase D [uncultured Quadrisphaera sp.]|uniref:Phosphodiesterase/alkaline phosphatase D n=1 Tax=uncultured Quadrisphaera sp. TaxID=904978 RepID=A0A6J4NYC3_9ACTN|nr:MAG: Phosphodiesterase/alkaline phosphatase D [uncultured Quadrisphaera sp.]